MTLSLLPSLRRLYRRWRYGEPLIVVSGLPRSGTSMAMNMLRAGGVELVVDGERTADEDNPKGYFEHERIKDLSQEEDRSWLRRARGKGVKIISYLLKDLPPENNYKVIFLNRHLEEVLASQKKMLARRGETSDTSDERMMELYQDHLWRVGYLLRRSPHLEALEIHYSDVLSEPRREAERIAAFLGGGLDVAKMAGVVDESLYRNRA
jgi:hypothetical protein